MEYPVVSASSVESGNVGLSFHEQSDVRGSLYYLTCLFRSIGVSTSSADEPKWLKYVTYVIVSIMWSMFMVVLEYAMYKVTQDTQHELEYDYIAILLWLLNTCVIYSILVYEMMWGRNIIATIAEIASETTTMELIMQSKSTDKSRSSAFDRANSANELYFLTNKWVVVVLICALYNMLTYHVSFGADSLVERFIPTSETSIAYVLLPMLIICNVTAGIPLAIVRVMAHFTEKRITVLIEYLEGVQRGTHDVVAVMTWYDDLYEINRKFSRSVTHFVTCSFVIGLPNIILLVQAAISARGSNSKSGSISLSWIVTAVFFVAVVVTSVARVDSLNRRFEIALGNAVSSDEFKSFENAVSYDLALAKARALPFGVKLYGTRSRISFSSIFRIVSIVVSIFLFILGYKI